MAYRWFLGYDLLKSVQHFTTFGKNYKRRFEGADIVERIFSNVLDEAIRCKLVDASASFDDLCMHESEKASQVEVKLPLIFCVDSPLVSLILSDSKNAFLLAAKCSEML